MSYRNVHTAARRYGDTVMCSDCKKQWDTDDEPPFCNIEDHAPVTSEDWAELKESIKHGRPYRERPDR